LVGQCRWLVRPFHRENVVDDGVVHVAEAGDRPDRLKIDLSVLDDIIPDMNPDNLTDNDIVFRVGLAGRDGDGGQMPAFETCGSIGYAWHFDLVAIGRFQAGEFKLTFAMWAVGRCLVHRVALIPSDKIEDKLTGRVDIRQRVLCSAVLVASVRAEHDTGRIVTNGIEVTERGDIVPAFGIHSADPADGPGHDKGFEGGMGQRLGPHGFSRIEVQRHSPIRAMMKVGNRAPSLVGLDG